jgi:hypothetical protein
MKKIVYLAPEMEVFEMKVESPLLSISTGGNDPVVHGEDEDPGERILE